MRSGPGLDPSSAKAARRAFLAAALRRPATMGAVAPSSARLAGVLASVVPRGGGPVVVELGPGTGSVSAAISDRLPAGGRHLAVEIDPDMVAFLRRAAGAGGRARRRRAARRAAGSEVSGALQGLFRCGILSAHQLSLRENALKSLPCEIVSIDLLANFTLLPAAWPMRISTTLYIATALLMSVPLLTVSVDLATAAQSSGAEVILIGQEIFKTAVREASNDG